MENVLIGSSTSRLISATLADESTPPERKTPTGTSLIIRRSIERSSRCRTSAAQSIDIAVVVGAMRPADPRSVCGACGPPRLHEHRRARGPACRHPRTASAAAARPRTSGSAPARPRSTSWRGTSGSSALISEANANVRPSSNQYSGLIPSRSRATSSRRSCARPRCANANMPTRRSHHRRAVLLVQVDQHLGVAAASGRRGPALEVAAQRLRGCRSHR